MRFNFGQWAVNFGSNLLGLFASKGTVNLKDVGQIAAGTAADEAVQDNKPKP